MTKPMVMRFGIPSIDELFGAPSAEEAGISLPQKADATLSSVSLCITGPGGTGKSILGMHLASRYLADCRRAGDAAAKVLYVSTDLKHEVAKSVWDRFGLKRPDHRTVPFRHRQVPDPGAERPVELRPCHPLQSPEEEAGAAPLSHYLGDMEPREPEVYFVDLASKTAGDDWGFVSRVLSVVERVGPFPHLMIIDSVEGFETLVGERDAFGESQPRRSRVAQILRAAGDKWHIVFIIEEPKEGEHLAEEFVTDVVIRLRSIAFRDYGRRTVEIVKARGQAHVRGQHILLIRSGAGSTTGMRINHDDPQVLRLPDEPGEGYQSYVHVCPSLHHLNRSIMTLQGQARPANEPPKYAAFGIRYLDDMLAARVDDFKRDKEGNDQRGLRCRTTTALIGNSQTQKSPLGHAFLSRCFRSYAEAFAESLAEMSRDPQAAARELDAAKEPGSGSRSLDVAERAREEWRRNVLKLLCPDEASAEIGQTVIAAALRLGPPQEKRDGVPILLTTHDLHAEMLVEQFLPWLLRKVPALAAMDREAGFRGCVAAFKALMVERSICRRLEIHDMPSAVLVHIVQRSIETAQRFLFQGEVPEKSGERYTRSSGIRVVIDDLSVLRDTYAEIRDDPLLLRCLLFLLGREGVTTLLIDTQEGHPHLTVPSPSDSELRSLVAGHIYTWRFPFYDGNRVAIAAIPSMRPQAPTVIRELREGTRQGVGPEAAPLVVDPHFELYSGIETGKPKPIPLMIVLFDEMPAFSSYISEQDRRCRDLFTPLGASPEGRILSGVPAAEYLRLFELASTQRDTLLDYALLLQVDEFWSLKHPGIRRSGAARPVWEYLYAKTSVETASAEGVKSERIWAVDPHSWFQRTRLDQERRIAAGSAPVAPSEHPKDRVEHPHRRADDFVVHGYSLMDGENQGLIDRVPFMWDFGFLLCRLRAWEDEHNEDRSLKFLVEGNPEGELFKSVADVWSHIPKATKEGSRHELPRVSWRAFLEACYQLARAQTYTTSRPTQAFDLHASASPGLSCLILEIWASEILKDIQGEEREAFLALFAKRGWAASHTGLIDLLTKHKAQLFRTWLLLVEVLDLEDLASALEEGRLGTRKANPSSIAVRHWYKTAWEFTQNQSVDDPVVPAGLPGHFSVRGDWFLAVAGGSRSERLADQALDFLNTRSANYQRLRYGLGLPVRRIVTDQLRTGIITLDYGDPRSDHKRRRRVSKVHYENLIRLGGPVAGLTSGSEGTGPFQPADFHWFWRSQLAHFARHTRIWHDWLSQTILWWNRMRQVDGGDWVNGFERYDRMTHQGSDEPLEAWELFSARCEHLIRDLKDAAPA